MTNNIRSIKKKSSINKTELWNIFSNEVDSDKKKV